MIQIPKTEYGKAVLKILNKIGNEVNHQEKWDIKVILAGGAAMHVYSENYRVSEDVDAIFNKKFIIPKDLSAVYLDKEGKNHLVIFDYNYNETLSLMHPDFIENANPLSDKIKGLTPFVLSPLDLAVSKVSRFYDMDRQDILHLAKIGLIRKEKLIKHAYEALDYYIGNVSSIEYNIKKIGDLIESLSSNSF